MMEHLVVYEDDELIVINKPNGLLVHRSKLADDAKEFALQIVRDYVGSHVYPVHRLDRKTSGLLLFVKDKKWLNNYRERLAHEKTVKTYSALVRGFFPSSIELDYPLNDEKGIPRESWTNFECIQHFEIPLSSGKYDSSRYSLIKAYPKTGRMHQIRRHLNHLRHPIIGDRPHGCNKQNRFFQEKWGLKEMLLHAEELKLYNQSTGSYQCFQIKKPAIFCLTIENLSKLNTK